MNKGDTFTIAGSFRPRSMRLWRLNPRFYCLLSSWTSQRLFFTDKLQYYIITESVESNDDGIRIIFEPDSRPHA